jgi:hypothetical protein
MPRDRTAKRFPSDEGFPDFEKPQRRMSKLTYAPLAFYLVNVKTRTSVAVGDRADL